MQIGGHLGSLTGDIQILYIFRNNLIILPTFLRSTFLRSTSHLSAESSSVSIFGRLLCRLFVEFFVE